MFKYGITCALEPQPLTQPAVFRGNIDEVTRAAGQCGYDGVELFLRNPRQYSASSFNTAAKNAGVRYCCITTGMEYSMNGLCLISDDSEVRKSAISRLKEHLEFGAAIGCGICVGIMRGNIPDMNRRKEYLDRFTEALYELDGYAGLCGGEMVLESIHRFINNYLNSATDAADYLRSQHFKHITLHIDVCSMLLEDDDLADSIRKCADVLGYVHFPDSNRGYPGAGIIDFRSLMHALIDGGYDGFIDLECQPFPTEFECASRGLSYLKSVENIVRIEKLDWRPPCEH